MYRIDLKANFYVIQKSSEQFNIPEIRKTNMPSLTQNLIVPAHRINSL